MSVDNADVVIDALNAQGQRLTAPRYWFETAIEEAGIESFTWHHPRHTFASRLVRAGVNLRTVQELMGGKTISVTAQYAHLAPTHPLAAVERLTRIAEAVQTETPTDTKTSTDTFVPLQPEEGYAQHAF